MTAFEIVGNNSDTGMLVIGFMDPKLYSETNVETAELSVQQRPVNEQLAGVALKGVQDYEIPDAIDG